MADTTVNNLTALGATPAAGDSIPIWDADAAAYKRVVYSDLMGATLTGGGTIATGGYTLTVPATGTAALLSGAQTFTGLKTFSAGLVFADETLDTYNEGTWTPTVDGATTSPTVTYTTQVGLYTQIGNIVFFSLNILTNTCSGGSGSAYISLPITVGSYLGVCSVKIANIDFAADAVYIAGVTRNGTTTMELQEIRDALFSTTIDITDFGGNDDIIATGFYLT